MLTRIILVWSVSVFRERPSAGLGAAFLLIAVGQVFGTLAAGALAGVAALAAVLSELSGRVPYEPGSLAYEAFGTEESATTFYVKESWSSREDADRHARRVETDGYLERSVDLLEI